MWNLCSNWWIWNMESGMSWREKENRNGIGICEKFSGFSIPFRNTSWITHSGRRGYLLFIITTVIFVSELSGMSYLFIFSKVTYNATFSAGHRRLRWDQRRKVAPCPYSITPKKFHWMGHRKGVMSPQSFKNFHKNTCYIHIGPKIPPKFYPFKLDFLAND